MSGAILQALLGSLWICLVGLLNEIEFTRQLLNFELEFRIQTESFGESSRRADCESFSTSEESGRWRGKFTDHTGSGSRLEFLIEVLNWSSRAISWSLFSPAAILAARCSALRLADEQKDEQPF